MLFPATPLSRPSGLDQLYSVQLAQMESLSAPIRNIAFLPARRLLQLPAHGRRPSRAAPRIKPILAVVTGEDPAAEEAHRHAHTVVP